MSPLRADPVLVTWLGTISRMFAPIVAGGGVLLPGRLVHVWPQTGAAAPFSNPLNALCPGNGPPLRGLFDSHCEPQKYTVAPPAWGWRSPMTNCPPAGSVN